MAIRHHQLLVGEKARQAVMQRRLDDLVRFYAVLDRLEQRIGGRRMLSASNGRMAWPRRGVYFFMEGGEERTDSGSGLRIVRVGTHALTQGSGTTLWKRLSQHKGQKRSGGGNHRGSVFRLLIGCTLVNGGIVICPTWGVKNSAPREVRKAEEHIECHVSRIIGAMPFLWLAADDEPGPNSLRGYIERNSIALLSNFGKGPLDAASLNWRGRGCDRGEAKVRDSGLWNQRHVEEPYDSAFLDVLADLVDRTARVTFSP